MQPLCCACLQDILTEALSAPWSPAQVEILEQTLGSETVLEAVKRNEAELSRRAAGHPVACASTSTSAASSTIVAVSPPEVPSYAAAMFYILTPNVSVAIMQ